MSITISVSFRGESHSLTLESNTPLATLCVQLEELTGVPPSFQKLLYKGKKSKLPEDATVEQAGIKDGLKIQLLGSTEAELNGMRAVEDSKHRRDEILKKRETSKFPKPRATGGSSSSSNYKFHKLVPLPHLPAPDTALSLLKKLSSDPAVQHIMQKHQFSVGVLTELAPHEQPHLLGLNENHGQSIKLRLRTDAYDGFRLYSDVRRVLCHELTHNVWGDHDENFKQLNSLLNKEIIEFERGTHSLRGSNPSYDPSLSSSDATLGVESEAHSFILGGSSAATSAIDSREDRRRRALDAAINRLRKEEEELEHSCGLQIMKYT
ncbi:WLM-domain-containing [Pyrrhoderma noxium]|uniref:WLM-domain-containing n=1 Tax=Pyrrhoderma noxium TaxID=2282107 RepID=A0A286UJM1_9AGAM|nr:WLM-domain-containing [Pyrrhoderma noxium]